MTEEQKSLYAKARNMYPIRPRRFVVEHEVFMMAWQHGHSGGESEVLSFYADFASVAQSALTSK